MALNLTTASKIIRLCCHYACPGSKKLLTINRTKVLELSVSSTAADLSLRLLDEFYSSNTEALQLLPTMLYSGIYFL